MQFPVGKCCKIVWKPQYSPSQYWKQQYLETGSLINLLHPTPPLSHPAAASGLKLYLSSDYARATQFLFLSLQVSIHTYHTGTATVRTVPQRHVHYGADLQHHERSGIVIIGARRHLQQCLHGRSDAMRCETNRVGLR